MTLIRTNLTSKQILTETIDYAIPLYLNDGETKEGMLGKFDGDMVKLIQFLREREFEKYKTIKKSETQKQPEEKNRKDVTQNDIKKKADKSVEKKAVKTKSKKQTPASNQKGLF